MLLDKSFFKGRTESVAKRLLGTYLVHRAPEGRTVGRIVETEAYLFQGDPACHAHRGMTKRNRSMFGAAGTSYIYLIYGMYYCFNVVTGPEGVGEAVLIRALEPVEGLELMKRRRGTEKMKNLCSGPGKLVMAMGMDAGLDGAALDSKRLCLLNRDAYEPRIRSARRPKITTTTRIGIKKGAELPLRYYLSGSEFVSKK